MKNQILVLLVLLSSTLVYAQPKDAVLMTIDGEPIMKSEFEYTYFKNNPKEKLDRKAVEDYLELYKKFKLKVIEAERLGYDTLPAFQSELRSYRSQLARPYLTDSKLQEELYEEAYSHLLEDVEVSHILIRLPQGATPEDTIVAYQKALEASNRVRKDLKSFDKIAREMSEDKSVETNGGYLGYFTGLMAVWPFEKAMYDLPIGEISSPIRTTYGYHVIHVHSRRAARGQIKATHIMKLANSSMTPAQQDKAYQDIVALAARINEGEDFEELARKYSDDKGSSGKGGDLSWFGIGRMVKEFEDAAYALEIGEVSMPVRSQFGWHIIKLTGRRGIEPFEKKRSDIQRAMQYDERSQAARVSFTNQLKQVYNYELNQPAYDEVQALILKMNDNDSLLMVESATYIKPLVTFANQTLTQRDFIYFTTLLKGDKSLQEKYDQFVEAELLRYEERNLEQRHPEFALLMKEYHDGILLFDISNRQVWDFANRDHEGLTNYFNANKEKYGWNAPRYKGYIIRSRDEATLKMAKKLIKKAPKDSVESYLNRRLNNDSIRMIMVEKGIWKKNDNGSVDRYAFKNKEAVDNSFTDHPYVYVTGKMLKKGPEEYRDVRGSVVADYQTYLEELWIKSLEAKYPIVVNQEILESIVSSK